jgi:hypothetical protein
VASRQMTQLCLEPRPSVADGGSPTCRPEPHFIVNQRNQTHSKCLRPFVRAAWSLPPLPASPSHLLVTDSHYLSPLALLRLAHKSPSRTHPLSSTQKHTEVQNVITLRVQGRPVSTDGRAHRALLVLDLKSITQLVLLRPWLSRV